MIKCMCKLLKPGPFSSSSYSLGLKTRLAIERGEEMRKEERERERERGSSIRKRKKKTVMQREELDRVALRKMCREKGAKKVQR